jgi:hypothetical protein
MSPFDNKGQVRVYMSLFNLMLHNPLLEGAAKPTVP